MHMHNGSAFSLRHGMLWVALAAIVAAGCTSPRHRAPVEDRGALRPAVGQTGKVLPGSENAGKPGYYTVKPGDTLMRIGVETGLPWRDIQRWNELADANAIEVGQVLRVAPPGAGATPAATTAAAPAADAGGVTTKGVGAGRVEAKPLDAKPADAKAPALAGSAPVATPGPLVPVPSTAPVTLPAPVATPPATAPAAVPAASDAANPGTDEVKEGEDGLKWSWPSRNGVAAKFDEGRTKGLVFTGAAGDPVSAASDGRVIYAGSGLRGYGNLVIIQHPKNYLTAYAHNQKLLVKEDQVVRRGQRIAEMGSSDAPRVQLLFELRKAGKPMDPSKLMPGR